MNPSGASTLELLLRDDRRIGGGGLADAEIKTLLQYYELVVKWNPRLHLTTLTDPQEFFERHILESLAAERKILPVVNSLWDLGSGAGVPGLIIAVRRPDLAVTLVEASRKKSIFLEEAAVDLGLKNIRVLQGRFETLGAPGPVEGKSCVTARAVEEMERLIPEILRFGAGSQIILFGNETLARRIDSSWAVEQELLPGSERRFLITVLRSTWNS